MKIDYDFVCELLEFVHERIKPNNIRLASRSNIVDICELCKENQNEVTNTICRLVDAFNNGHPAERIDELFYQLSNGVIRYYPGQIDILTNPEPVEAIDPETLI